MAGAKLDVRPSACLFRTLGDETRPWIIALLSQRDGLGQRDVERLLETLGPGSCT